MMMVSDSTAESLQELVRLSFDCNAQADNFAYNIGYAGFPNMEDVFHHSFAHIFPNLADIISNLMIKLNIRPVRRSLDGHEKQYANLKDLFNDNVYMVNAYRSAIKRVIDIADLNEDYEVRIEMEDFMAKFLPYVKQANLWYQFAERYGKDEITFDVHFEELTTYIPIMK